MKLTIFEVYKMFGGSLRNVSDGTQQCKCILPTHSGEDRRPSARMYLDTNKYYCYVCGGPFDPIRFYRKMKNINYEKAILELRNMGYEIVSKKRSDPISIDVKRLRELREVLEQDFDKGVILVREYYRSLRVNE